MNIAKNIFLISLIAIASLPMIAFVAAKLGQASFATSIAKIFFSAVFPF